MEDTGIPLLAHGIPTPTHKCTILQCTGRREGQKAGRTIGADKTTTHSFGLGRIIESPSNKEHTINTQMTLSNEKVSGRTVSSLSLLLLLALP